MSKIRTLTLKCRHCNKEFDATIYDSINVTLNPELKDVVYNFKLFDKTCPHCNGKNACYHPFVYNNMDKRFMVSLNSEAANFWMDKYDDPIKEMRGFVSNYNCYYASSEEELITKITALENDLDPSVIFIDLAMCLITQKLQSDIALEGGHLTYTRQGNLSLCFTEKAKDGEYYITGYEFNRELYDSLKEKFDKVSDEFNKMFFNEETAMKFVETYLLNERKDENEYKIAICGYNHPSYLAYILPFVEDKFNEGDEVPLWNGRDTKVIHSKILKIETVKDLEFPYDINKLLMPIDKPTVMELTTKKGSDEELDNEAFKYMLDVYTANNCGPKFYIEKIAEESEVILPVETYMVGAIDDLYESLKTNQVDSSKIKSKYISVVENGKEYLCLYLSQDVAPENATKYVHSFTDIFKLYKRRLDVYDGIKLIDEDKIYTIDNKNLFYLNVDLIMTNEEKMKEALKNLTDSEKEYMQDIKYKIISMIYFDGKSPKEVGEELSLSSEEISKYIGNGYRLLKRILLCKTFYK